MDLKQLIFNNLELKKRYFNERSVKIRLINGGLLRCRSGFRGVLLKGI